MMTSICSAIMVTFAYIQRDIRYRDFVNVVGSIFDAMAEIVAQLYQAMMSSTQLSPHKAHFSSRSPGSQEPGVPRAWALGKI
jgi:hypothetical protein